MVKVFTLDEIAELREQALASTNFAFVSGIVDRLLNSNDVAAEDCLSPDGFPVAKAHLRTITEIQRHYGNCLGS